MRISNNNSANNNNNSIINQIQNNIVFEYSKQLKHIVMHYMGKLYCTRLYVIHSNNNKIFDC